MEGEALVRRMTVDRILSSDSLERIRGVLRDISEKPLMLLVMRGVFKDEEWVDYLATVLDTDEMVREFEKRLGKFFNVVSVVRLGPFDLAAIVDFKDGTPDEKELLKLMDDLETDMIDFLTGPDYLGKIKEQVDILESPFKSFVDFSIGHAFLRRKDEDGIATAVGIALKDAETRKRIKISDLTAELLRVLDRQDLHTYFQPIVDLDRKEIFAYEALVRGPEGSKLRDPKILFKIAALNGLEMELDKLARRIHLKRFSEMMKERTVHITVNLGPFTPMMMEQVDEDIRNFGIPPELIIWEVSERTYVDDFTAFTRVVNFLTSRGYKVAVDDFGAGATSLKLAYSIDAEIIKVDMELVKGVEENYPKRRLLAGIIESFGRSRIVVEGVERVSELRVLADLGYEYYQGFLFSKPTPEIPIEVRFPELP